MLCSDDVDLCLIDASLILNIVYIFIGIFVDIGKYEEENITYDAVASRGHISQIFGIFLSVS